jgi:hypothetical protein
VHHLVLPLLLLRLLPMAKVVLLFQPRDFGRL